MANDSEQMWSVLSRIRKTTSHFMLEKPEITASLMYHLLRTLMVLEFIIYCFMVYIFRNVFSRRHQTVQDCVFSGMVLFASTTAMHAADDGISNSMVPSVLPRRQLME